MLKLPADFKLPVDPAQAFRDKANKGDVAGMLLIYNAAKEKGTPLNISEKGLLSGKSAAMRAAEMGHAHVLRLLYNLGDDLAGAFELAKTPECKKVFKFIAQGKQALEAANKVFPHKVDVEKATPEVDQQLKIFRKQVEEVARQNIAANIMQLMPHFLAAPELLSPILEFLMRMHDHCQTLKVAMEKKYNIGACDENSVMGYTFLVKALENKGCVDQLQVKYDDGSDHMFVGLGRDASHPYSKVEAWKEMLLVDPYQERCLFYEHLDSAGNTLLGKSVHPHSSQLTLCCSSHPESMLPAGLKPSTVAAIKKIHESLQAQAIENLDGLFPTGSMKNKNNRA